MGCALAFRNVTLGYDRHPAVHHLDGKIESGALVAVVGPNGAGKSTLFKGIVGVLKPLGNRQAQDRRRYEGRGVTPAGMMMVRVWNVGRHAKDPAAVL